MNTHLEHHIIITVYISPQSKIARASGDTSHQCRLGFDNSMDGHFSVAVETPRSPSSPKRKASMAQDACSSCCIRCAAAAVCYCYSTML